MISYSSRICFFCKIIPSVFFCQEGHNDICTILAVKKFESSGGHLPPTPPSTPTYIRPMFSLHQAVLEIQSKRSLISTTQFRFESNVVNLSYGRDCGVGENQGKQTDFGRQSRPLGLEDQNDDIED